MSWYGPGPARPPMGFGMPGGPLPPGAGGLPHLVPWGPPGAQPRPGFGQQPQPHFEQRPKRVGPKIMII